MLKEVYLSRENREESEGGGVFCKIVHTCLRRSALIEGN